MQLRIALAGALLVASLGATAASAPDYLFVNRSAESLIDDATAKALFGEIVSQRLAKLYPTRNWGFVTQVVGGLTANHTCVVTARVMMLPRNMPVATKLMLFKPQLMAATFDAVANASEQQCREVAKTKLREANQALLAGLIPS